MSNPIKDLARRVLVPGVPRRLADRFLTPDAAGTGQIEDSLRRNYFTRQIWGATEISATEYLATQQGADDMAHHLFGRLEEFREDLIPWFDSYCSLDGLRVLEIGCGTGASTVALAEQGAVLTALDLDEPSLAVARDRLDAYGLEATLVQGNAAKVHERFEGEAFDLIIFFATMEHLTHEERIASMRGSWEMLKPGGLWSLVETPNRLWFFDHHTSDLPFYHWLPDDLALRYSSLSPRPLFNKAYEDAGLDQMESFLRHGRGVSYHEFDLAMGSCERLDVVSGFQEWQRRSSLVRRVKARAGLPSRFRAFLREVGPPVHPEFYERDLYLTVRKP